MIRLWLACLIGLVWLAPVAYGQGELDWLAVGYEDQPTNTDPVPEGDDRIRDARINVRIRAETEHCWGDLDATGCGGTGQDSGRHRNGAAREFWQAAAPTVLEAPDNVVNGAGDDALDSGRKWVDSDNNRVWVYDSAWEAAVGGSNYNLIYNGSFEATDGDGDTGAIVVPEGWTAQGTATFVYDDEAGAVGGYAGDVDSAHGYHVVVTAVAGAAADGMIQIMLLPPNTTFWTQARVEAVAGDTCRMDTDGATTDMVDQDAVAGAWETVAATFATGAAAEAVTLRLTPVNAGDICSWDSVQTYKMNDVPRHTQRFRAEYDAGVGGEQTCGNYGAVNCDVGTLGLAVVVNPPGPGYITQLSAMVYIESDAARCDWRIRDATTPATISEATVNTFTDSQELHTSLSLHGTVLNPVPGTPVTYQVEGRVNGGGQCQLQDEIDSWIEALLVPN